MRARDLCVLAVAAACTTNPDPRRPTLESVQTKAFGGWIVLTTSREQEVSGELIALDATSLYLLELDHPQQVRRIALDAIQNANLFEYEAEGGLGAWTGIGAVSTLSHGFFLVFSMPIWLLTGGLASSVNSNHVILHYPGTAWNAFAEWARFPQGLPPRFREPATTARPTARDQAWRLTQQAWTAARAGDCSTVFKLDGEVLALDAELHDTVFVRDVAIAACLAAQPTPMP